MPNTGVTVELVGLKAFQKKIQKLTGGLKNFKPLHELWGIKVKQFVILNFEKEGTEFGKRWRPLSPTTLERRRKHGTGAKILQDTGQLKNSIAHKADTQQVAIGTGIGYGKKHQLGIGVPKRPFLPTRTEPLRKPLEVLTASYMEKLTHG